MNTTSTPAPDSDILDGLIPHVEAILAALTPDIVRGLYDRCTHDGIGSTLWMIAISAEDLRDAAATFVTKSHNQQLDT